MLILSITRARYINLCAVLEMRENEAYTAMPGNLLIVRYFQPSLSLLNLTLIILKIYISFVNLCAGLEMGENEAYTSISELQENFEMSKSICYAVTEPKRLH